jgi:hypothetical protein
MFPLGGDPIARRAGGPGSRGGSAGAPRREEGEHDAAHIDAGDIPAEEGAPEEATDQRTQHAHDDVPEDAEPSATHRHASQPAMSPTSSHAMMPIGTPPMMPGPQNQGLCHRPSQGTYRRPWPPRGSIGTVRPNLDRPGCGHLGACVDDLQIAWLIIGWLVAFWAGKDLQTRFVQWRSLRRGQ